MTLTTTRPRLTVNVTPYQRLMIEADSRGLTCLQAYRAREGRKLIVSGRATKLA